VQLCGCGIMQLYYLPSYKALILRIAELQNCKIAKQNNYTIVQFTRLQSPDFLELQNCRIAKLLN